MQELKVIGNLGKSLHACPAYWRNARKSISGSQCPAVCWSLCYWRTLCTRAGQEAEKSNSFCSQCWIPRVWITISLPLTPEDRKAELVRLKGRLVLHPPLGTHFLHRSLRLAMSQLLLPDISPGAERVLPSSCLLFSHPVPPTFSFQGICFWGDCWCNQPSN